MATLAWQTSRIPTMITIRGRGYSQGRKHSRMVSTRSLISYHKTRMG